MLEAAHIRNYSDGGAHQVPNGLLVRRDIHRLFDLGYVTITTDKRFHVSHALKDDFANGRTYYAMHGSLVQLPERIDDHPSATHLEWHNETVFRGSG